MKRKQREGWDGPQAREKPVHANVKTEKKERIETKPNLLFTQPN